MGAITEPMMMMMLVASDAAFAAAAETAIIISSTYKLHCTTISSLLFAPCHSLPRSAAIGNKSFLPCLFLCILLLTRSAAVRKKTRSASSRKEWLSLSLSALHFIAKFKLQTRYSSNNNLATCSMKFPKNGIYSQKAILKIKTAKIKCFL
jgi:hypothetical protein